GDPLQVKASKLSSTKTQLPYDYYFLSYCKPPKIVNSAENLGEVLQGDRIENSAYNESISVPLFIFKMMEEQSCKVACRVKIDAASAKNFKAKIDDEYRVIMILDNLPVAVIWDKHDGSQRIVYERGFRVGFKGIHPVSKDMKYFINNHLHFSVMYHEDPETDSARIVGFELIFSLTISSLLLAIANSMKHEYKEWDDKNPKLSTCKPGTPTIVPKTAPQEIKVDEEVVFTYDVSFKSSDIRWASRWDIYLYMKDNQIHWFSIMNSLIIMLFLSVMVAMVMMRTLYRDIAVYNQLDAQDEAQEESGWKLVHGDVFRPPSNTTLLCVYAGTGVQVFGMTLVTMIFALLGFLSPSSRGSLMTAMVLLYMSMGLFAGYSSARLYKMFRGTDFKFQNNRLQNSLNVPRSSLFGILRPQRSDLGGEIFRSSAFWYNVWPCALMVLFVSPAGFSGQFLRRPPIEDPIKTNKIPRPIPPQPRHMNPIVSILVGGVLPFGAVFIELFFILTSMWLNQFYYIFGFLFIVFIILLVTCAEITIVLCYFHLCSEDYRWWWRAYLTAGSSALYLFLYSAYYFFTKLEITKLVSGVLYFGYMVIGSYAFFVLTGTIGFYACFWFVRKIYSSVKID
ncbi:LOW QUALITY PROTEIN: hypothetical protein RJ639_041915, partial [Escallonia herrerae]